MEHDYCEGPPEEMEKWIVEHIKVEFRNGYREVVGIPINKEDHLMPKSNKKDSMEQPTQLDSVLFDVTEGISSYFVYIPEEYVIVSIEERKAIGDYKKDCIKIKISRK